MKKVRIAITEEMVMRFGIKEAMKKLALSEIGSKDFYKWSKLLGQRKKELRELNPTP